MTKYLLYANNQIRGVGNRSIGTGDNIVATAIGYSENNTISGNILFVFFTRGVVNIVAVYVMRNRSPIQ